MKDRIGLSAIGMVIMQASVALSEFGAFARLAVLAVGFCLIVLAALVSAASLPRILVIQIAVIICIGALGFEALSAFNAHLVFEPKLIVFRGICYVMIFAGIILGISHSADAGLAHSSWTTTLTVILISILAPIAWTSLRGVVLTDATRGTFDDSSPVALGFSSGALAIAALAVSLRSSRLIDYFIGIVGYAGWFVVCLQSGSRGALLSVVLASIIVSGLSLSQAPKRVLALLLLAVVLITGRVALGEGVAGQATYVLERFESILNLEADASIAGSADSRAYLLDHNLKLPGLLLLGGEGFDPQAYPHNFEVEALVRLGAPLALVFVAVVFFLVWRVLCLLAARGSDIGVTIVLAMGLFTFFNSQTNLMWEMLRPLWLALGIALGVAQVRRVQSERNGKRLEL
jgi:hypothetical protein